MKGRAIPYSAAEMAWLEANRFMVVSDYARAFRATFGRDDVEARHLHALRKRMGWRTGRTGCFEKGQAAYNKGKPCEPGQGGRHPNARRTQFRKGNQPHNTRYAGHERVSKDGYIEISVEERNPHTGFERRYVLKHKWLWGQANGSVPEGCALKCLDGNRLNTDPSNWEPLPRAVLARLNGGRCGQTLAYDEASPEVRPLVLASARLKHAAHKARRNG
ncbi:MAG: HNH endonuclease [Sphingobium sp.]